MNISRRSFISAVSLLPLTRLAGQESPTFSTDVKVVNVFATVRDKKGQIVKGLNKEDFLLEEEGKPQTIQYFSRESDLPLTLGLLVDTSGSQRNVLSDERSASYRFFDQILREDRDLAFLIHFDREVELLQDLTSSRDKLEKSLDDLTTGEPRAPRQPGGNPGGGGPYPGGGGYPNGRRRGGTSLYDAVLLASDELMRKQKGRKALVLLTDGVDNGSKVSLGEAISAAQRADTLVYSVLFSGSNPQNFGGFGGPRMGRHGGGGYPRGGSYNRPDGKKVLQQISQETGGRFFEVAHNEPISKAYADIEEDLRNQYSIGYSPEHADSSGGYRHIHLATKQKDLKVQAREGYYAA